MSPGHPTHDEDLGQVLRSWGVPCGPDVYFPLLGPSSATEAVSATLDMALAPSDTPAATSELTGERSQGS